MIITLKKIARLLRNVILLLLGINPSPRYWEKRGSEAFARTIDADGFGNLPLDFSERLLNRVKENIENAPRHRRILDFGCGTGRYLAFLENTLDQTTELYGIDMSLSTIENYARKTVSRAHVFSGIFWTNKELFEHFDVIYSYSVIQYIYPRNLRRLALRCAESLSTGGQVHLYFPVGRNFLEFIEYIRYLKYLPEKVESIFAEKGFRVISSGDHFQ